jgi:hypothetical protein
MHTSTTTMATLKVGFLALHYLHTQFPPAVTLTPSRSVSHTSRPHAILVAVDLCYIWKTAGDCEDSTNLLSDASPFADNLYLPFELLIKRVTEQLFNQLVGCVSAVWTEYMRSYMTQTLSPYLRHVVQSMLVPFCLTVLTTYRDLTWSLSTFLPSHSPFLKSCGGPPIRIL